MKILLLSPHTDDIELSMGATIAKYMRTKAYDKDMEFDSIVFSDCGNVNLRTACIKAHESLGLYLPKILDYKVDNFPENRKNIQQVFYDLTRKKENRHYSSVFVPSRTDRHQDHNTVTNAAIRIFSHSSIFGYHKIQNYGANHDWINLITEFDLKEKQNAISYYGKYVKDFFRRPENARIDAQAKGLLLRQPLAETFEVIQLRGEIW